MFCSQNGVVGASVVGEVVGASVVCGVTVVRVPALHKLIVQQSWSHDWMFPVVLRASHPGLSSQLRPLRSKHPLVTVVVSVSRLNASSVVQTSPGLHCTCRSPRVQFLPLFPWHSAHVRFFKWKSLCTVKKMHTLSFLTLKQLCHQFWYTEYTKTKGDLEFSRSSVWGVTEFQSSSYHEVELFCAVPVSMADL